MHRGYRRLQRTPAIGSQIRVIIAEVLGIVNCLRRLWTPIVLVAEGRLCRLSAWTIIERNHYLDAASPYLGREIGVDELRERLDIGKPGRDGKPV